MCGLVGVLGTINQQAVDIFNDLLVMNQLRGAHSTGVATVGRGMDIHLVKALGPPNYLKSMVQYSDIVTAGAMIIMGHGRYATVGEIVPGNAHPFHMENVVGAHNGTLAYWTRNELNKDKKFGTDSEAMMQAISDKGLTDVIPTLEGAWAITVYDKVFDTFNMIRNKERPLSYARINDDKTLIWASEPWMIMLACGRAGLSDKEISGPYDVSENHLFTWDMVPEGSKLAVPKKSELSGKKPAVVSNHHGGRGGLDLWHGRRGWWFDGDFYPVDGNGQPWEPPSGRPFGSGNNHIGFHRPMTQVPHRPGSLSNGLKTALNNLPGGSVEDGPVGLKPRNGLHRSAKNGGLYVEVTYADEYRNLFECQSDYADWIEQGCLLNNDVKPIFVSTKAKGPRIRPQFCLPKDERGRMMDQRTFDKRTRHGCDGCGGNLHWGQAVKFIDHQTVLGACCYDDEKLMNWLNSEVA